MNPIEQCEQLVKEVYMHFDASHDFQHIERVRKNAFEIAAIEPTANREIIELAVLLHDVSDPKYAQDKDKQEEDKNHRSIKLSRTKKSHRLKKSSNLFLSMVEMNSRQRQSKLKLQEMLIDLMLLEQ